MDPRKSDTPPLDPTLTRIAERVVGHHRAAPAAVVAAAHRDGPFVRRGVGAAGVLRPGGPPADVETMFDLASVTKPVTALLAARLVRRGASFGVPLSELLPEAVGTPSADVPLELFLSHRAGLDAHRPLFVPLLEGREVDRREALAVAANARRPECPGPPPSGGFPPVYSDLGYLLAGEALSRLVGEPLATAVHDEVTLPLGIDLVTGDELAARGMVDVTAPTEDVPFRGGVVRAQVHDENAWALSRGGLSGHAGLFGRAACVLELGVAILDCIAGARPEFLSPLDVAPLWKRRQGGTLRMGFDGKAAQGSSAGAKFGRSTFGHLGFTGTSLWMDPDAGVVGVLLTNRVHPTRTGDAIRAARPEAYDAIFDWATSSA